jgi:nucleoid-associated protein YgaU
VPDIKLYMDMSAREQTQSEADSEEEGQPIPFTAAADQRRRGPRLGTGEKWALGLVTVLIAMTLMLQTYMVGEILRMRTELGEVRSELSALPVQFADMSPPTVPRPDSSSPDLAAPAPPLQPEAQMGTSGADSTEALLCDRYQIQSGDTLSGISRQFYKTPEKADLIAGINGFSRDTELRVGTTLLIPRLPDTAAQPDSTPEPER